MAVGKGRKGGRNGRRTERERTRLCTRVLAACGDVNAMVGRNVIKGLKGL